jgi:hypothetical protein
MDRTRALSLAAGALTLTACAAAVAAPFAAARVLRESEVSHGPPDAGATVVEAPAGEPPPAPVEMPTPVVAARVVVRPGQDVQILPGDDLPVGAPLARITVLHAMCLSPGENSERFVGATRRNRAGGATDETRCWTSP